MNRQTWEHWMNKTPKDNIVKLPDRRTMEKLMSGLAGPRDDTSLDQAQQMIYDAWEAEDPAERIELAEQALRISPDCADAWVLLAQESAVNLEQVMEYYQKGVEAGERALGEPAFEQDKGYFWGLLETRPYMRARSGLAQCLWEKGERDAAIGHYQEMLELNPNDNQGLRHLLLACLLDEKRHAEADQLIQAYSGESSAVWCYSQALLAFRREGDSEASRVFRKKAIDQNGFVPAYLAGRRKLPKYPPEYIGFGDRNEAVAYVFDNRPAWRDTPGAIPWLLKVKK